MNTLLAALLLAASTASAASLPMRLNFQGKLLDPATNAPKNGTFSIAFRIYDGAGNVLWGPETHAAVAVNNGVFSVQLGSVLALTPQVFANGDTHLGVTVGADGEMTPRQQLVMSPYAFTAAQLAHSSDLRLNAGLSYSTFTAAGNLLVPYGVSAGTASFAGSLTASSGTFTAINTAAITASSNVVVAGGMLNVPSPGGISTDFGVIAATVNVRTSADAASVRTSSSVLVEGGTLQVNASGGVSVLYGVSASTFTGSGADLSDVRPEISSMSANNLFTVAAGVEVMVASATVVPARATSKFMVFAGVGLNRANNNLTTWTLRVRRQIAGNCTTASTQVGFNNVHTVPNTAGTSNTVSWFKTDAPSTTSPIMYCVTVNPSGTQTMDERQLTIMEIQ